MRVGIVVELPAQIAGGSHTFVEMVLHGLCRCPTKHDILLLVRNGPPPALAAEVPLVVIDLRQRYGLPPPPPSPRPHAERVRALLRRGADAMGMLGFVRHLKAVLTPPPPQAGRSDETLVAKAVQDLQLDLVWFTDPFAEVLPVPYLATVWDLEHRKQPYFPEVSRTGMTWEARERLYSRVLPRAAGILTGTETGRDEIVHYYRVNPANVIVNPFPTPTFVADEATLAGRGDHEVLAAYGLAPGFLLYPAQFWPHKNHVNLLHALKILETQYNLSPPLVLTGADKGNLYHVQGVINQLDLLTRVRLLGFIPDADLAALYRTAAMTVFPSFFGPDNLPPLEALYHGCPVVVSDIPGARDQLGDAVEYFDPTDPDRIAEQIARVLNDPGLRESLVNKGKALCSVRTPENYINKVYEVFNRLLPMLVNWNKAYMHS